MSVKNNLHFRGVSYSSLDNPYEAGPSKAKTKSERTQVEQDAIKLKNRIAMLEVEERKMKKKITDTS
jgi:hypothetical protein